ncbi:class I SAM-dependent methyltransferase [Streptomyces diastatochromogenes]|uniref:S-adenosyl-L-methionine-dependent methyltransferase n=1 Tax=Streptomyces diastatochromogenes TaxID=42236 RepID=A0A233SD79_STRDA|nr:class I SAM-dependent methyltransferase [Streptomyces diastatochromogenes]MCZ0987707.1 class I SAM-dependent methyltransferase [Streptomyces diastatochromogenes]OXY93613.1 methyltransferase [Streptomyces diastatochromogenes]
MQGQEAAADHTAVRVALWRALHVQADPPPHVIDDEIGLRLTAPDEDWRGRPDMDVEATRRTRASIVARARFVEDLVVDQAARGVGQYVLLGAGLDTFAQRRPEIAATLRVFEVDRPGPQAWKRQRLAELGYGVPEWLRLVPVDFEGDWWGQLVTAGLDPGRPAVVAATGVTMYLTGDAVESMFRLVATLAAGSTLATTFLRPLEDVEPDQRPQLQAAVNGARAAGTPFLSFFTPPQILALARESGFREVRHVTAEELGERYFADRTDGLRPSRGEELLVATT